MPGGLAGCICTVSVSLHGQDCNKAGFGMKRDKGPHIPSVDYGSVRETYENGYFYLFVTVTLLSCLSGSCLVTDVCGQGFNN